MVHIPAKYLSETFIRRIIPSQSQPRQSIGTSGAKSLGLNGKGNTRGGRKQGKHCTGDGKTQCCFCSLG